MRLALRAAIVVYMAIYHAQVSYTSRGGEGSVCANAAYITGEKVKDYRTGDTYSYAGKEDEAVYNKILVPDGKEHLDTAEKLWNDIEAFEDYIAEIRYGNYEDPVKQAKSLAAKERFLEKAVTGYKLECALPIEFTLEERKELVDRIAEGLFGSRSLPVQYVIHNKEDNPHAHFLSGFRPVVNGEYSKRKVYYQSSDVKRLRQQIADITNAYAQERGYDLAIDHRSLEAQGIDRLPTRHEFKFLN